MEIGFRPACAEDAIFARDLYFETMRSLIERLFGWDQARQERSFADFFKLEEVQIITANGKDVGWFQEQVESTSVNLGSLYVTPEVQRRGIGSEVLRRRMQQAAVQGKAVTLSVMKINPALHFYERHGFRITHADEHKFYMRAEPPR